MSVRNLDKLFKPASVAVIGASNRPASVGRVVMQNLLTGGFDGPIMPVNPQRSSVCGVLAYPDIPSLPVAPDLGVICTPPQAVPQCVAQLAARGTKAAIVLTAGTNRLKDETGRTLTQAALDAARPHSLRILGPNCVGMLAPLVGLNASFAHIPARPGRIAFVSQSGALCTAVLDWAEPNAIGFSCFISLGDGSDIDFGDLLDYLGSDPDTGSILLYIESISDARKFMSAARAAARNKPVVAIKAGRAAEGAKAAASHTGALAGSDAVYDAALRRAGALRVYEIDDLFNAVETLARARPVQGDRLAILTNGGGPGVISTDELVLGGGTLAALSDATLARLDGLLPATWSKGNPVDIIGDAPPERYRAALEVLLEDPGVDALLVMHVPTAISSSVDSAKAVAEGARSARKNVLTSWLGRASASIARRAFAEAGLPTYDTPDQAVRAFMHMVEYRRNQELLMQTPPSAPEEFTPNREKARATIEAALANGRSLLTEPEAKDVLAAYGIPVVATKIAADAARAEEIARSFGGPVALKILSPDLSHKSDVGGVALDLETPEAVRAAADAMLARIRRMQPEARIDGFTVQEMARRPGAHELLVGIATDAVFGPVVLFGQGGTAVEVVADRAIALPPLNLVLAEELVARTRVAKLLRGYRDRPPAALRDIELTLMKVAQIAIDFGEVLELDINPLFADETGVLALDARIKVAPFAGKAAGRLAIRPYPQELEECATLRDGSSILMRPIRPEDEPKHREFHSRLSDGDIRFRFFGLVRELQHSQMARFTQIDYDREMAFVATGPADAPEPETLGVVRVFTDPDNQRAEFAIVVRSDQKGRGLGRALMEKMVRYAKERGTGEMIGQILAENKAMLGLATSLGFEKTGSREGIVEVRLKLREDGRGD